ncbi:MFS transporter [Chloroflexota bacterium]
MHFAKKPRVFYGYWIVVAAFFCVFIFAGCGFYAFSLFVKPLQADFGWGRGGIMAASTIFFLVMGVASPFIGRLVDRYGARKIMSIGAFVAGFGFILLSLMDNLWYIYGGWAVVGGAIAAIGPIPTTAVVLHWFKKRRGTTIGIMTTGVGAGGFALAPLVGGYLIPSFGWRASYLALALLTWILIPLVLLVIRTKPADMGLYPDGMEAPETVAGAKASLSATEGLTLKMALATPAFWLISVSFLANDFSKIGVLQNQVPYIQDIGFPVATAATALGVVGLGSLIGKLVFGWLCDRIQAKYACSISLGLTLAGTIILTSVRPASPLAIIWLYAIVMGLGVGGWLPTMSMLISTNFGLASYGAIFGIITLAQNIGTATGPLMAGYMYDAMNTYHWAFLIFLALYTAAIPAILAVRRPKSPE